MFSLGHFVGGIYFSGNRGFWLFVKYSVGKVDAATVSSVDNQSGKDILTVHSTFYNYRYDKEMTEGARTQGSQSSDNQFSTHMEYLTKN